MLNKLSTLQRILLFIAGINITFFISVLGLAYRFELEEVDFLIMSASAAISDFLIIWLLLKNTFKTVEQVANNIQKITDNHTAIHHGYDSGKKFKLKTGGHQKEVQDLVDAFNNLVDEIHDKAEKSNKIIGGK